MVNKPDDFYQTICRLDETCVTEKCHSFTSIFFLLAKAQEDDDDDSDTESEGDLGKKYAHE